MTIKQTIKTIRESTTDITVRWLSETKEYRLNLKNGNESTAYYADNCLDAINTAKEMQEFFNKHLRG